MTANGQSEDQPRSMDPDDQDPRFLSVRYQTETTLDLDDGMEQRIRRWRGEVFDYGDDGAEETATEFEFTEFWVDWDEDEGIAPLDNQGNFSLMDSETGETYGTWEALVTNWPGWVEPVSKIVVLTKLRVRERWWGVGVESFFLDWLIDNLEFGGTGSETAVTWWPWAGVDSIEDGGEKSRHQDLLVALVRDAGFVRLGDTHVWAKHLAYSRQLLTNLEKDK